MKRSSTNQLMLDIQNYLFSKKIFAWRQNVTGIPLASGRMRPATKKGVPDILGCYKGHFFGVEVKKEKESVSHEQRSFHSSIFQAGGKVFVARSFDDFVNDFEIWEFDPPLCCSWIV